MTGKFIEEMGVLFGEMGAPPMSGRIFAWLLICDPPEQTATELGKAVGASKGSISSNIRMLVSSKLVERTVVSDSRQAHFCIKPGSWAELMEMHVEQVKAMKLMANKGMELIDDKNGSARTRLLEMLDFYSFMEREIPKMMERYKVK
jgi:DNA-binding transcriptional regulator GbsR (MarR family)